MGNDQSGLKVLVLGASGNVGKASVAALSKKNYKVFAGMRNVEKGNDMMSLNGVQLVEVDQGKKDQVQKVINDNGIEYVFVIVPGPTEKRTEIALNAIEGVKSANGVKGMVTLSVMTEPLTGTIFSDQFKPIEDAAQVSGVPQSIIRVPLFTENVHAFTESIKKEGKFYSPLKPDAKYVSVSTADIGEAVANIISNFSVHQDRVYSLASDYCSSNDIAKYFTKALGKKVEYVQVPFEAAKQAFMSMGFPEWQTDGIMELYMGINEEKPILQKQNGDLKYLLKHEPTSTTAYIEAAAGAFQ